MAEIDWDAYARVYDVFNGPKYNVIVPAFCAWMVDRLDEAGGDDPSRMIEIGSRTGLLAERMANWYRETAFTLVEEQPAMARVARERFDGSDSGNGAVEVVESGGDAFVAGLPADSVEVLILSRSFYSLVDHERAAADMIRALKPDGRIFLFDFTQPVELAPLEDFFSAEEPADWPVCRAVYEDFNEGVRSGRYQLFDMNALVSLWRGVGGWPLKHQDNSPRSNTQFMAITKGR